VTPPEARLRRAARVRARVRVRVRVSSMIRRGAPAAAGKRERKCPSSEIGASPPTTLSPSPPPSSSTASRPFALRKRERRPLTTDRSITRVIIIGTCEQRLVHGRWCEQVDGARGRPRDHEEGESDDLEERERGEGGGGGELVAERGVD